MELLRVVFRNVLLLVSVFLSGSCSPPGASADMVLVGCTPGDELVKTMLRIPAKTKVDFIRWNLRLGDKNNFALDIAFGESKPNTLGFKDGGEEKRDIQGTFTVDGSKENDNFREVYDLKSDKFPGKISFVKLTNNVFHLLTPQNHLMIGNGGWSYSLSRKKAVDSGKILISSAVSDSKSRQLVFDGRTPCHEIANEHPEMSVSQSCFKLKWKLILNRDSVTYLPTTYTIRKVVDGKPHDASGNWVIITGIPANPDAIVYKIEPDKPGESISFLVGDDNVLFFLNKNDNPYVGNEDFSFTLNRKFPK